MNKFEIEKRLDELKDYEKISIITMDNRVFDVNYSNIKNNVKQEYILIDALFEQDRKMFLYCSIYDIFPA